MSEKSLFRILCFGDVVARPGRGLLRDRVPKLRKKLAVDMVIANGENASGGTGLDLVTAQEMFDAEVDVITLGDHTWRRRELRPFLDQSSNNCIRPGNFSHECPGRGSMVWSSPEGVRVGVMNLIGRTFMSQLVDCPFRVAEEILTEEFSSSDIIICDFHAEATSEKLAFGRFIDGRIDFVFGTHTHVPTADLQFLQGGTGYVTDIGMCGSKAGVIGMDAEVAIDRFLTGIPSSYKAARGGAQLDGVLLTYDLEEKKLVDLERIFEKE